jgi:outer membrane protein TolC
MFDILFNRNHSFIIFLLILIIPTFLLSQDRLTLDQAWTIALKNNYTLQQQENLIEKAREEISIRQTDYYPSLSSSGLLARANFEKFPMKLPLSNESGKVGIDLLSLSINQSIFSGFQTKNMVASAREKLIAQEIHKSMIQNAVLVEVGNLYYELQYNRLQQQTLKSSINRIKNQQKRIINLYTSEQATPYDTLEISNKKLQLENQLAILQDSEKILWSNFKYLLNEEELSPLSPLSTEFNQIAIQGHNEYIQQAIQIRPELKNLSAQKKAHLIFSDGLKARYYPHLSASFGFNFLKMTGDLFIDEWTNFYSFLINFQWELWNWNRDSKKVQQARLDIQNLELQESQLIQDIKYQIKIAYQNLLSTQKKILLQKKLVSQEQEKYRITEERYNQGLATFLDLDSSELDYTAAETELLKNYINWYKNRLQLDYATGMISKNIEEVYND